MKQIFLIATTVALVIGLTGCADPFEATTRSQIKAQSDLAIAQAHAEAQKQIAIQETARTGMVVAIVPWALLIIGGIVLAAIVLNWQGRIAHTRVQQAGGAPALRSPPDPPRIANLRQLAAKQGYEIKIVGNTAYLIDGAGRRVGQRQLTG